MGLLSKVLRSLEGGNVSFKCPGCKTRHVIGVSRASGPNWTWNNNADAPTFTPSILVRGIRHDMNTEDHAAYIEAMDAKEDFINNPRFATVCHSFITDGKIQYLGDCTHELRGQTVPLGEFDETPL